MCTVDNLLRQTEEFFNKHWDSSNWSMPWTFEKEVPDNTHPGCYALVNEGIVVYIGLALNKGAAGYEGHSLGTRVKKYWRLNKELTAKYGEKRYMQSRSVSDSYDSIYILAFKNGEQAYLAASLELYLIKALAPKMNQRGK
jgi:hypothetical protein